jgi:hypothetical protein
MKTLIAALSLLIILFTSAAFSQESFEGKVKFDVEENGQKQVMNYHAKDKKFRMEIPDKGGAILFNSIELKMYVLMDKEKMYMETPMMPLSMSSAGKVSKTGETKNILGYHCEKFVFEQADLTGEAWMTDELGAFMFFMESQQEMPEWQREILDAGYFPLHVTQYNKRENKKSIYNVIEVTPMKLSEDLFVIPPSYEKLDLSGFGGLEKLIGK